MHKSREAIDQQQAAMNNTEAQEFAEGNYKTAANDNKRRNIEAQIEGLGWHIAKLKSYKITDKSCSPQFIINSIKEDEEELTNLKNQLHEKH